MIAIVAITVLFGYVASVLLATDVGRAVLGAGAGLLIVAVVAASMRLLLPPDRSAY
jgi:hypothetical protein